MSPMRFPGGLGVVLLRGSMEGDKSVTILGKFDQFELHAYPLPTPSLQAAKKKSCPDVRANRVPTCTVPVKCYLRMENGVSFK